VTVDSPSQVKVSLFKDLFRGREDVYAVRWEGRNGKTGYSPAGDKEWGKAPSSVKYGQVIVDKEGQSVVRSRTNGDPSSQRRLPTNQYAEGAASLRSNTRSVILYSYLSAINGLTFAARRAGM
jgi:TOTE conflict system primase-like protein